MKHSYVILAIKVPEDVMDALNNSAQEIISLMKMQGIEDITVLNTIPAPTNKES